MPDEEKNMLYMSLISICIGNDFYLKADNGGCLVVETAKEKEELKHY